MNDTPNCTHRQFTENQSYCPDCGLSQSEILVAACEPYLKDGESPAECIARNRRDVDGCLTMLIEERRKADALAARLAEAETQNRVMWDVASDREARLTEAEIACDSWKREAELNQQAADEAAGYAHRLAEAEALLREARERMSKAETTARMLTGQLPQYSEGQQMLRGLAANMGDSVKRIDAHLAREGKL